jgi:hypothetical protein
MLKEAAREAIGNWRPRAENGRRPCARVSRRRATGAEEESIRHSPNRLLPAGFARSARLWLSPQLALPKAAASQARLSAFVRNVVAHGHPIRPRPGVFYVSPHQFRLAKHGDFFLRSKHALTTDGRRSWFVFPSPISCLSGPVRPVETHPAQRADPGRAPQCAWDVGCFEDHMEVVIEYVTKRRKRGQKATLPRRTRKDMQLVRRGRWGRPRCLLPQLGRRYQRLVSAWM